MRVGRRDRRALRVLAVNAGSSSLKLTLLDADDNIIASQTLEAPRAQIDRSELRAALDSPLGEADAIGHRIVHGGERYRNAVRIDGTVEADLRGLVNLAPLHQPKSLAALDAVSELLPDVPAVACFDTAFHATLPRAASTYALPALWRERWGLRRYGFHGLSHAWVARRTPELLDCDPTELRIVSCHLGAGASLCAIDGGRSLDTTMGFTPLEGLVMATRSGSVDPGILLWLAEHEGLSVAELADALEHHSGLLGLAGTADMREIIERDAVDEPAAQLALAVYVHRLRGEIAGMTAALGGLDALVFTGGVGERSAPLRALTVAGLGFLGVELDGMRNDTGEPDRELSGEDSRVRAVVIEAREDLEIGRQVRAALTAR
jgi:acetate kinase